MGVRKNSANKGSPAPQLVFPETNWSLKRGTETAVSCMAWGKLLTPLIVRYIPQDSFLAVHSHLGFRDLKMCINATVVAIDAERAEAMVVGTSFANSSLLIPIECATNRPAL